MNHPKIYWPLVFMAMLTLTAVFVSAQSPGSLDTAFAGGGVAQTYIATTNNNLFAISRTIAVQTDGKVVTLVDAHLNMGNAFSNVILRYGVDGTLDASFGSGGMVYLTWDGPSGGFGNARAVGIQNVGTEQKIVVAGSAYSGGLRVERYNADGTPDTTFGTNGRTFIGNGGDASGIAIQADGKIITTGDTAIMVRLNPNGALDASFGSGGVVQTSIRSSADIALQSSGKIVICGASASGKSSTYVARFNTNGSLDSGGSSDSTPGDSFGSGGKVTVSSCPALNIDSVDRILVGGSATQANSTRKVIYYDFAVTRLLPNGQVDTNFGSGGTRAVDISGITDSVLGVYTQADGKIVLMGITGSNDPTNYLSIARLNADGSIDTSFGQNGRATLDTNGSPEHWRAGALHLDPVCGCQKLTITGVAEFNGIDFAMAARIIL